MGADLPPRRSPRLAPLLLGLGLVGCKGDRDDDPKAGADGGAGTAVDTGVPGYDSGPDAPWIWPDDGEVDVVDVDLIALSAQLEAAVSAVAGASAGPLRPGIEAGWALSGVGCPSWFMSEDGTNYWSDDCSTEAGARFSGYGGFTTYVDYDDGDHVWNGFGFASVGTVEAPGGELLYSNGYTSYLEGVDRSGNWVAYSDLAAGTQWTGAPEAYLRSGAVPHVGFYALSDPERSGGVLSLAAQFEAEDSLQAVVFDELLFVSEGAGSGCAEEPSGVISAFVAEGVWVDVEFDGADWGGRVNEALCDGCGRVSLDGVLLGEVCLSFDALRTLDRWPLWTTPPSAGLRVD